jgi:hypothetical protein
MHVNTYRANHRIILVEGSHVPGILVVVYDVLMVPSADGATAHPGERNA